MNLGLTDWMMEFPARGVGEAPDIFYAGPVTSYEQAEIERRAIELPSMFETVKFRDEYFVIAKQEEN